MSNIGKPVVGGGIYRVTVRYGTVSPTLEATASWTQNTPNITMTSNPGSVVAGMGVVNVNDRSNTSARYQDMSARLWYLLGMPFQPVADRLINLYLVRGA